MLARCKACGAGLIEGPTQERSAASGRFRVVVAGLPVWVCPKGCLGQDWYWPDLGVEVPGLLDANPEAVARRAVGMVRTRPVCRRCGQELADAGEQRTFPFRGACRKGTMLDLAISGPALTYARCTRHYLPAHTSSWDAYYADLAAVIGRAVTSDRIWE